VPVAAAAAVDARVTREERLVVVDSEPTLVLALVSDATTERLRRLRGLSASSRSSSRFWKLSSVSSGSAVWRPRLRIGVCFGCSVAVEDEIEVGVEVEVEVEDVGAAAVFVRSSLLRFLLVDCFALVLVLALVALALRGEEGPGSEPIVAVVESLLNEECVEVSLVMDVVDPMVAMVEVLRSADGFGTLLDAEVEVEVDGETRMESFMSATA
jgi:hypothetical protein